MNTQIYMQTMTITLDSEAGKQFYFKIEFNSDDFMEVVDLIDEVTISNLYSHKLFNVIH